MGSCISKCRPKRKAPQENHDSNHVQDKLVMSQAPTSPSLPSTQNTLSLTHSSSSSFSSFSCTTQSSSTTSSLSSLSSFSSSVISSKDRSFSNEFLLSCAKENPQIIRLEPLKHRLQVQKLDSPAKPPMKQLIPERLDHGSITQKRARANSPTLTRQKSFRVEPVQANSSNSYGRNMRSPSPGRRFNGDSYNYNQSANFSTFSRRESCCKRSVSSARKENVRPERPNNNFAKARGNFKDQEKCNVNISAKIDEVAVREVLAKVHFDPATMEDIDNPLIALDCFIFL